MNDGVIRPDDDNHQERNRRQQAETSLHASEQLFRVLVESVIDYSIFVLDTNGRVATWNAGACKIKGYSAQEIIGRSYETFFTEEDRRSNKPGRLLAQATTNGSVHDEGWRLRKDGTTFWASATLTAMYDDQGVLRGYAKVTHDDTQRHEAAEALRRSEERFRLAVNALREHALYMLDPSGIIQSWNLGAERHKGYTAQEIIGQHFSLFFTDDDRISGKPMRELMLAEKMGSFEEEGWRVRKDGSRFWAAIVITAVHGQDGVLQGYVKVTRDETAKHEAGMKLQKALDRARAAETKIREHAQELEKRVEERTDLLTQQTEALKRTNADLEQFAYIASHDLKEPLRMITGYLDLLRTRYGTIFDDRANSYMSTVVTAAERMRELVEAVLEYSRYEGGSDSLEVVPLNEAVTMAMDSMTRALTECGGEVLVGTLPTVRANRLHLVRVFQNLIANAIKFRSQQPLRIGISALAQGQDWLIAVSDNGIGIDPTLHPRLFKIFQRLHTTSEYAGTGIGLASCKKIIEHHGGRIWVESAKGVGSTFKFTLRKDI